VGVSVLLIRAGGPIGETLARRLRAEGDEVRVVVPPDEPAEAWRELGVKVAPGHDDADLIERAAQGVRTAVVIDGESGSALEVIEEVVVGISAARVERLILCARKPDQMLIDAVRASGLDYVVLTVGGGGLLSRRRISVEGVAEAIDAADDLAGSPRLELDLTKKESWATLGLNSPPKIGR